MVFVVVVVVVVVFVAVVVVVVLVVVGVEQKKFPRKVAKVNLDNIIHNPFFPGKNCKNNRKFCDNACLRMDRRLLFSEDLNTNARPWQQQQW